MHHGEAVGELYDLAVDPRERRNLWDDAGAGKVKAELMQRLLDRVAYAADPLPERIGAF